MYTISGTVVDMSGNSASGANVNLMRFGKQQTSSNGTMSHADGRFRLGPVPPGEYGIETTLGEMFGQQDPIQVAFQDVHLEAEDVSGLVITLVKGADVTGHVSLEGSRNNLPEGMGSGLMVMSTREDRWPLRMMGVRVGAVMDDHTFTLTGLTGRRTFDVVNLPHGWYVKSVRYNGEDVSDVAVELKPQKSAALESVISTHGAVVSGRAIGNDDRAIKTAVAVLFPANPALWSRDEPTTASLRDDGEFRLGPRRPGAYLVAVLDSDKLLRDGGSPEILERIARIAEHVTLAENEQRTLDLRIVHLK